MMMMTPDEFRKKMEDFLKNDKSAGMYKPNFIHIRKKGKVLVYSRELQKYKAIGRNKEEALRNLSELLGKVANSKDNMSMEELLNRKKPWYKQVLGYFFEID